MPATRVLELAKFAPQAAVPAAVMFTGSARAIDDHGHAFFELAYVRTGSGVNIIDGRPYPMIQGDVLIMQPGDVHRFAADSGSDLRLVNVLFTPALWSAEAWAEVLALPTMATLLGPRRGSAPRKLSLQPDDARQALAICRRLQGASAHAATWRLAARTLITEFLLLLDQAAASYGSLPAHAHAPDDPIALAVKAMHADPAREVSVASLAREAGLTAAWFGERFRRQTGLPVRGYLSRLRLEEARRRLEEGASVTDAALAVGFQDPSYFARLFRRFAQLPPRAYRRLARGDAERA